MSDRTYIKAADKIEKFMEGALDKEISAQIKRRAIVGGLCMAIPLYGLETIIYAICLWGEYGKISEISGVPFRKHAVRNIVGGFILNLIVTFVLNLIMDLIPGLIISSIGGFVVGYTSLEISGMGYVKMLQRLHGKKAKADLNISGGIANLRGKSITEEKAIETKDKIKEIKFDDGSKYIGTVDANGYLFGKGKYFWPNGGRYEGEYNHG